MAFSHSPPQRQPFLNAPASVLALVGALVAVHLAVICVPVTQDALLAYELVPARYAEGGPFWTLALPLVSHMFLHINFLHLAVNSLFLLAFGAVVARRLGAVLFFVFTLCCGLAAAAATIALDWGSPAAGLGASGAVSGLMAAGFRLMRWRGADPGDGLLPVLSPQILKVSAVWLAGNLVFAYSNLGLTPEGTFVDWRAHMGGFVFGLLTIGLFDRFRRVPA